MKKRIRSEFVARFINKSSRIESLERNEKTDIKLSEEEKSTKKSKEFDDKFKELCSLFKTKKYE